MGVFYKQAKCEIEYGFHWTTKFSFPEKVKDSHQFVFLRFPHLPCKPSWHWCFFFWSPPKKGIYVVCVCINTCIDDCINVENTSALHSAYLKMYQCDRYDTYNWKYDNYFSIVTMYARQWWYIQLAIYIYHIGIYSLEYMYIYV